MLIKDLKMAGFEVKIFHARPYSVHMLADADEEFVKGVPVKNVEIAGMLLPAGSQLLFKDEVVRGLHCKVMPRGGITIACVKHPDGRTAEGRAYCSPADNFWKKRGVYLALKRALKLFRPVATDVAK